MALSCGIIGLPNVGKSTLFNCLTSAHAVSANYPFCTIEPNIGVVEVPDRRLDALASIVKPERIFPAAISFVDIAGLVRGASLGEGLGNKFLAHIRDVSAICHVVRCFDDNQVIHVENTVNPQRDVEIIETELILKDIETTQKQLERAQKAAKGSNPLAKKLTSFYETLLAHLNEGKPGRSFAFDAQDEDLRVALWDMHLLSSKPTLFIANVDEKSFDPLKNPHLASLQKLAQQRNDELIVVCAKLEEELVGLTPQEKYDFLQEAGFAFTGLERLIREAFKMLRLQTFLTAGEKEVRAWTISEGTKAPQAAGVIHTDFERGFIKADVIWWEDFIQYKGEAGARAAGAIRLEGKEYVVRDGDVIHFKFNV